MSDDRSQGEEEDLVFLDEAADREVHRDRDGVSSMRDTEAESGDEDEVDDTYDMDQREARQLGVQLDGMSESEPRLA